MPRCSDLSSSRKAVQRVAILHSRLSSYMLACWRRLHEQNGVELLLYHEAAESAAPFQFDELTWIRHSFPRREASVAEIARRVVEFAPDAVLTSGWKDTEYLRVAREMRRRGVPVIAGFDGQWLGTFRQRLRCVIAPLQLHPSIDVLWAAGARQVEFARRLGYGGQRCWRGVYCCDWQNFARDPGQEFPPTTPIFMYVGRYVEEKGVADLLEAYRIYRQGTAEPWDLVCVGAGPLAPLLRGQPGVRDMGFIQSEDLPAVFKTVAGVFVLPSRAEPWGVVVQEAAASGLPIICSEACGSGVHLVQEGYNGWVFDTGETAHLAACMRRASTSPPPVLRAMGRRSHQLSRILTPEAWATTFVRGVAEIKLGSHP